VTKAITSPISPPSQEQVAARWTRLGASFSVAPAHQTPDLERLLLDTVRLTAANSRLFIMAATWLAAYSDYVAKRRLAVLIRDELEDRYRPIMGLLLDFAQTYGELTRFPFREALQECHTAATPGPLLNVSRRNAALVDLAQRRASKLSRKWGCWMEDFTFKLDALRPAEWIAASNPSLAVRAISGGDLVATIAADAAGGNKEFASESALARRYGASRASVRAALRKLTLAGYAHQSSRGKARPISLSPLLSTFSLNASRPGRRGPSVRAIS
jgi:hypothetical protein